MKDYSVKRLIMKQYTLDNEKINKESNVISNIFFISF